MIVEGEAFDIADGGYGWVDVLGITPERQRPYEEVVEDVKAVYRDQETTRQMAELACDNLLAGLEGRPLPYQVQGG